MMRIEDLKVGDELVCIDRDGFLSASTSGCHLRVLKGLIDSQIIVSGIASSAVYIKRSNHCLYPRNLKHFKKKEEKYIFNDLIDVAVQGFKDGILSGFDVESGEITIYGKNFQTSVCDKSINQGIKYIQSLYKETFVIEHASDLKKIKRNSIIKLENGNEVCAESDCLNNGVNYIETTYGGNVFNLSFIALRGATVEQSIGGV